MHHPWSALDEPAVLLGRVTSGVLAFSTSLERCVTLCVAGERLARLVE
jgi:hypothetical protein